MKIGAVLALDLATTTGWALHLRGLQRPLWDSERLPGGPQSVGEPADRLERLLRELQIMMLPHGGITHFFFEAQHIPMPKKGQRHGNVNIDTVYRLIALGGIVEKFAYQVGGHCYKVEIPTWRKHFLGRGSGFKRTDNGKQYLPGEDPKELAIQRCAQYGWHTDIGDEAEALGILDFSLTLIEQADQSYIRPWRDNAMMEGTFLNAAD